MADTDSRDLLARDHPEYRSLLIAHRDFESRLLELRKKPYLNSAEQLEETTIKKHKLRLKDRMEALARELRPRG